MVKCHEVARSFERVVYTRKLTAQKFCKDCKQVSFEYLILLFCLIVYLLFAFVEPFINLCVHYLRACLSVLICYHTPLCNCAGNNAGTAGTAEGEAIQPSNVETGAESHPMMPRAQPSAPQWEGSDRWREGQAGQGYPPYPYSAGPDGGVNKEAASQDPPSYSELFPSHPTHKC